VNEPISINDQQDVWSLSKEVLKFITRRQGIISNSGVHIQAYFKSRPQLQRPDTQIHFFPFSPDVDPNKTVQTKMEKEPGFMFTTTQMRPQSCGSVHIQSANAQDAPLMQPNFFHAEEDRRSTVDALKFSRELLKQPAIARYIEAEIAPGTAVQSDDELLAYAQHAGGTMYHGCGTCRMGVDENAVVDPSLQVHGIRNLMIADASVMPAMCSGNTNAPTIMIAEKAADMLLAKA